MAIIDNRVSESMNGKKNVFIIGSKSIGQYGGYETFVDKLTEYHQNDESLKYHIACKANGEGHMDISKLKNVTINSYYKDGSVKEFSYHNAHVFLIKCPRIGPAVAIYYDCAALLYSIRYCRRNMFINPIFYVLTCRIGPFMYFFKKRIKRIGGLFFVNPDGHEWLRSKWSNMVKKYWKLSEKLMIKHSDLVICDSKNIEKYIQEEYNLFKPNTVYIAYGSEITSNESVNKNEGFNKWCLANGIRPQEYYLVVGRFVPENNYETIIREFIKSSTSKDLVIITNENEKFRYELDSKLHFSIDNRVKFVGTVYDKEMLQNIRKNAYCYIHGHEVGGTNPSLLEAMGSTNINLLYDVGFNREVGEDSAYYWNKEEANLSRLIESIDGLEKKRVMELGEKAKKRIAENYSWQFICDRYKAVFCVSSMSRVGE